MTLVHPHPKISNARDGSELWAAAQRWSESVNVPLTEQPKAHFAAALKGSKAHGSGRNGAIRGKYLEIAMYDFAAKVVTANGADESCIRVQVDMMPGHNAEADILVNDRLAILVKTSFRERWKQVDRDALLMSHLNPSRSKPHDFRVWSVFYAERDNLPLEQIQKKAVSVARHCLATVSVGSILDIAKMAELESDIKWAVK